MMGVASQVGLFEATSAQPPESIRCPWAPGETFWRRRWFMVGANSESATTWYPWTGATLRTCEVCQCTNDGPPWVRLDLTWTGSPGFVDVAWEFWGLHQVGPINDPALWCWTNEKMTTGHADCLDVPTERR